MNPVLSITSFHPSLVALDIFPNIPPDIIPGKIPAKAPKANVITISSLDNKP
jgi:hypothetical protein